MLKTRRPLQEKLVLFWHGHFATGNEKVRDYRKMLGQFETLREHANGNLHDLLIGIGKDPAMLIYPPNVKGWDGGRTWINPATIFQRQNVARYILFPEESPIVKDAHLAGSRRLSGDFIHIQFLEMAERGDYASFPKSGAMADGAMAGGAMPGGAMTETSKLSGEDFNLFRGVFNAAVRAVAAVPAEPRRTADFNLGKMLQSAGVADAPGAVDYLMRRFLRAPITGERRQALIRFLEQQMGGSQIDFSRYRLEKDLRELLHLIMSAPEYQLS